MLKPSNFNIRLGKSDPAHGTSWGISVELTREFYEFAKAQRVDKKHYEDIAREVLRETSNNNVPKKGSLAGLLGGHRDICQWNKNFLSAILLPGSAPGLFFEDNVKGPHYSSHNLDHEYQVMTIMPVITQYLFELDYKIPRPAPTWLKRSKE